MPQVTETVAPPAREAGLVLAPFRGVRYSPARVADLARVTSPPYDVIDDDELGWLEAADPHNVVRLVLPRDEPGAPHGRYRHAARTLADWLRGGVLVVDAEPALYVYEQAREGEVLLRGLLGALGLRDPAERVVLPHEDVMPGPVADRLELMRVAQANVEPILLVHDGGSGAAADAVARAVLRAPVLATTTPDGLTHRVWPVSDVAELTAVAADLADRQALIADGHHRYAAYRALQAERHAAGDGPGPWDRGLALLVDLRAHPPGVAAIHRSVTGLSLAQAVERAAPLFSARPVEDADAAARRLMPGRLLLVDGTGRATELRVADHAGVDALLPSGRPAQWRALDTAVLHHALAPLWAVPESAVSYHHDLGATLRAAHRDGGLAVLLAPVAVEQVLSLAADGVRMPRKSTSFGPKPRTGLVLRTFAAG